MTTLNVEQEFAKVRANYEKNRFIKANFLIVGHSGNGKTHLLRTCPRPVYVDSFDRGGTRGVLSDLVDQGLVVVDDRWEELDRSNPTAFKGWDDNFTRLIRTDFFNHVGTYAVDSITSMSDALMSYLLKKAGKVNAKPGWDEYHMHQILMKDAIAMICSLPCYTVITGHIDIKQDESTGQIISSLMLPGKSATKIPIPIDEMYILEAKQVPSGIERTLLTQSDGRFRAKTRIGSRKFNPREPADIRALIKKAGFNADDKPLIK